MEEMPTQLEQDIAAAYCLFRPLNRPKTNWITAVLYVVLLIFISVVISTILCLVLKTVGILSIDELKNTKTLITIYILVFGVIVLLTLRVSLIGLVHLYQHYAPEWMRRRCMCMPTCSEYMILAIRKYGPFIGTYKGIKRLTKKCNGIIFKIDYPYN